MNGNEVRQRVRDHYGQEARRVLGDAAAGCSCDPVSSDLYDVDVIISNCVINLSADKDQVLREAFRVLRPGGRFAVSDIVIRGAIPRELRRNTTLWAGCFAGALTETGYRAKLQAAGFTGVEVQATRVFSETEARDFLASAALDADRLAPQVAGKVISAFVRAVKP